MAADLLKKTTNTGFRAIQFTKRKYVFTRIARADNPANGLSLVVINGAIADSKEIDQIN